MAPDAHRQAIRRQHSSWPRTATGPERDPRVDHADGHGKPRLGLHADPRSPGQSRSRGLPRQDCQPPSRTPPGARARSSEEDNMDRVPEDALGGPARSGLLYRGRLDALRAERFAVLFIIDLSTRRIYIAGIAPEPDAVWMHQMSRNLTDASDGFLTASAS